ncbi:MAG: sigma-70 family RNA polymerase sigma factor, partial [Myxococcota bacterium]
LDLPLDRSGLDLPLDRSGLDLPLDRSGLDSPASALDAAPLDRIVTAAQGGDPVAFTELVRRYAAFATAIALARTGRPQIADDVAQDALLDAWRLLPTLREPAAFGGWLRRVVVKHADRHTRRPGWASDPIDDRSLASDGDPESDATDRQERRRVRRAVAALPAGQREVVALFHLSGSSHAEIADLLGLPISTVKKRLHDARRRLAPLLSEVPMSVPLEVPLTVQAFVAARVGRIDLLSAALDRRPELISVALRPDVEALASRYVPAGATLLAEAVSHGHVDAVRLLLARGAEVDGDELLAAIELDQPTLIPVLLAAGVDPNVRTRSGVPAVHLARYRGRSDVAEALIAAGADRSALDASGRGADDWARFPGATHPGAPGRVIDPTGRPLDGGGAVAIPSRTPAAPDLGLRPTGIKAIDLLAPLAQRGVHRLIAGANVGKLVLIGELSRSLGPTVVAGLLDRTWDVRDFEPGLREFGSWSDAVVVMGATVDDGPALVRAALALAEARGGWVMADDRLTEALVAGRPGVPVVVFGPHVAPDVIPDDGDVTGRIVLDAGRAARGEWPAIDLALSRSTTTVSADHHRIAAAVRAELAAGGPRAERLLAWSTQPFRVAEAWRGGPGAVVPLADTLRDAAAVLAGATDGAEPASLAMRGALPSA